jgi:glycosyltransferase involved in cell wall biosynthesis
VPTVERAPDSWGTSPSVSVVIPTLNSSETLERCLDSVYAQSLRPAEVILVDGGSTDSTEGIAKAREVKLMAARPPGLLNSRRLGALAAQSAAIAMIDSDQVLEKFALEAAVEVLGESDMVILGEYSFSPGTWLERLFAADRLRLEADWKGNSDPTDGVLLPRVFRASILQAAFKRMPKDALESVVANDHNIVFYETWKLSNRLAYVPNAVGHYEVKTLRKLFQKQFRWGVHEARSGRVLGRSSEYKQLWSAKLRFRLRPDHLLEDKGGLASAALLMLKGGPYCAGYLWHRVTGRAL